MKKLKLVEKMAKENRVYTGRSVNFRVDDIILPDGNRATREFIEHPGAVAVIPFLDDKNIILVKQYRYPVKELTWEIPAGKIDRGEKPSACVRRELEEETGYRAKTFKKIASYWPTPAFATEIIHIYTAHGLYETAKSPDEDEFIDHVVMPFDTVLEWVMKGKIKDSKTVIAILFMAQVKGLR